MTTDSPAAGSVGSGRGWLAAGVQRFALALTFLTGLPVPVRGEVDDADLWASMGWYPLVGLGLGALAWGVFAALTAVLPQLVAAALVALLLEISTRGLHMDGLMDTCDGYFSGASRERALEIMKDSRAGAMGVVGAVLVLIVKIAALGALARADAAAPLLAGWAAARALPPIDIRLFAYARAEGTGAPFTHPRTAAPVVLATALLGAAIVIAAVVNSGAGGWWAPLVVAAIAMGVALLAQTAVARRLGGLTGDVYGMGIVLAETAALVVGAALVR
jgi:cobalamin 5'-phosphate synthase/cobalamin synthase